MSAKSRKEIVLVYTTTQPTVQSKGLKAYPLCLGYVSKTLQLLTWKKTGLHGKFYDLSVGYEIINVSDIEDTHKYLMRKHNIV